ncbi:MAG TPA: hypothetical protein VIG88_13970 [Lysobacter sp.]
MPHSQRANATTGTPHVDARTLHVCDQASPAVVFNGDQYVHGLMFQLDGRVYPISKLHSDHIHELFRRSRQARHTASMVTGTRLLLWLKLTGMAFAMLRQIPTQKPAQAVVVVSLFIVVSVVFWFYADSIVGPAARIQRRVRRELEEREALLRVELALITPHRRRSCREVLRAWTEAMRA